MNLTCILVPVYNHPNSLPWLIEELQRTGLHTLLVNDGSDQLCTTCLRKIDTEHDWVTLLERSENGGKGAAVKTGLLKAAHLGYSHALQLDADGQHDLGDIARFLEVSKQHPTAVITGTPVYNGVPALRLYARYLTHVWVWINTLSLDIKDSMCGFRIYPLQTTNRIIREMHTGNRMDFDPEILVRLHWAGVRVISIPTSVTYPLDGISHFRGFRDNLLISWAHTRLFFGMLMRLPLLLRRHRPENV